MRDYSQGQAQISSILMNDDDVQAVVSLPVDKQTVIDRFLRYVKGHKAETALANVKHAGKDGHWLEVAMGLTPNANNAPDILGYEMKNGTKSKTSFGDWSADYYLYKHPKAGIDRSGFLKVFGKPNIKKEGRYSWSGEPCPKISSYNAFGQKLYVDSENNVYAIYKYSRDMRAAKANIVPARFQVDGLVLASWSAALLKQRVESKFNQSGWFKCEKNQDGVYVSIAFGDPIPFETWIDCVRTGDVYFDSGMYDGNDRAYSQWRANNSFWDKMVTSRYK